MSRSFSSAIARQSAVTFSAQGVRVVCQFGAIAVLSRILPAGDIGMVGLMTSILGCLGLLRDFGLPSAIIQRETVSSAELNALFRASVVLGIFLFMAVVAAGFGASWFFKDPRLAEIGPYFGGVFLFQTLVTVPTALLKRQFNFGKLATRDIASNLIGTGVGIGCARAGVGYFSLVWMQVAATASNLVLTWLAAKWRPYGPAASFKEIKSFLLFGGTFTAGEFANYLCHNLDNLLIGKRWGFEQLGYYTRAYSLMYAPTGNLLGPVMTVLMPTMSRLRSNETEYHYFSKQIAKGAAWLMAPVAAMVSVCSLEITGLLLGDGWNQSAEILKWLSLMIYASPMGSVVYLIMVTSGEVSLMFRWVWANAALTIAAIVLGLYFGTVGTAISLGVAGVFLGVPLAAWFGGRIKPFAARDFLLPYFHGILFGAACFGTFQFFANYLRSFHLLPAATLALLGFPLAGLMAMIFFRLKSTARAILAKSSLS